MVMIFVQTQICIVQRATENVEWTPNHAEEFICRGKLRIVLQAILVSSSYCIETNGVEKKKLLPNEPMFTCTTQNTKMEGQT